MTWEALLWTAISVLAVPLTRWVWPRVETALPAWATPIVALGPWVHGVAPAYIALITGAVLSPDAGLQGHTALGWVIGALGCAVLVALIGLAPGLRSFPAAWPDPLRAVLDEPRWALYRATGALWTWSHPAGSAIGLGAAILEWALAYRPWRPLERGRPEVCATLARIGTSTLFFTLTRNLWLTMLSQGALMVLLPGVRSAGAKLTAQEGSTEET